MTRLSHSVEQARPLLEGADLADDAVVGELLALTYERRRTDYSDMSPAEQAALVEERCEQLQPSADALAARMTAAARQGRPFVAKFGIDPTGAEVHLGHAVPILVLDRFQRMGHQVVFIVGDVTAKIGDPSGRSDERPRPNRRGHSGQPGHLPGPGVAVLRLLAGRVPPQWRLVAAGDPAPAHRGDGARPGVDVAATRGLPEPY